MKIATWYNLSQKKHEAVIVGRGRPIRQDAPDTERQKSNREIFAGDTREAALKALAKAHGLKMKEVEAAVTNDTKIVYKGKREHPYNRKPVAA